MTGVAQSAQLTGQPSQLGPRGPLAVTQGSPPGVPRQGGTGGETSACPARRRPREGVGNGLGGTVRHGVRCIRTGRQRCVDSRWWRRRGWPENVSATRSGDDGVGLPWRFANHGESERARGWNRAYDARGVQRCQKRALGGPVSSASSTMAAARARPFGAFVHGQWRRPRVGG